MKQAKEKVRKQRLDILLVNRGLVESRTKAQALILAGLIKITHPTTHQKIPPASIKPGFQIPESSPIEIISLPRYVSRGGDKFEAALAHWPVQLKNKIALDVGASTGGFTDCLLQNGVDQVVALDVGYGQIHPKIKDNPKVILLERTHFLKWEPPWIQSGTPSPQVVTVDLSFISLKNILEKLFQILSPSAEIFALIKPQFEVGQKYLKKGIVKDLEARDRSINKVIEIAGNLGYIVKGHFPCPVLGAKGNQEEWLYMTR